MAGFNLYILKPEVLDGPPEQLKAKIYLRYRPDDENPGTETDMGVDARAFVLAPGPFNPGNMVLRAGIRLAVKVMYADLDIDDRDLLVPPNRACGLLGFFNSKEWKRVKP